MATQYRTEHELPIRIAKRLLNLQTLPYIVVTNPYIAQVTARCYRPRCLSPVS